LGFGADHGRDPQCVGRLLFELSGPCRPAAGVPPGVNPGSTVFGHPGDAWGWAAGAGIRFVNFLLPKDTIEAQFNHAKGAIGYVLPMNASTSYANDFVYGSGNSVGIGYAMDGVFVNGSQVHLTEAWSLSAAYQHYWNTQWRTSVIGGYSKIHYDSMAQGMLCGTAAGSGHSRFTAPSRQAPVSPIAIRTSPWPRSARAWPGTRTRSWKSVSI
jgi:hypothetical protein